MPHKLIVIDRRLLTPALLAALPADAGLLVIDPEQDGLLQLADALPRLGPLDAIHLLAHADSGSLQLGSRWLDNSSLAGQSSLLASIGQALGAEGDLLLYGCNLAAGLAGEQFVQQLATLTGADVAASSDLTGSGGDWDLEVRSGRIEAATLDLGTLAGTLLTLNGTSAANTMTGSTSADYLDGKAGNDTLNAGGGNDTLFGGSGNDLLDAGGGNDSLYGDDGSDTLLGSTGNDYLQDDYGSNRLDGGSGNDTLFGSAAADTLIGGSGDDELYGGYGNDVYYIDSDRDIAYDEDGTDIMHVQVDNYLPGEGFETIIYDQGVKALPYFILGLGSGTTWSWIGSGYNVSYSFVAHPDSAEGVTGFEAYTSTQKAAVRSALAQYAAVSGLTFTERADDSSADVRFFRDDLRSGDAYGYAGYAWYCGDVHITSDSAYDDLSTAGEDGFLTLLHEIGHAMGLKHPHEAPILPADEDNMTNTVMTYNFNGPLTSQLGDYDLATLHYMYGVNTHARSGNDTYSLGSHYIWDGAGTDTLSASNYSSTVTIDLTPGSWNHAGGQSSSILAVGQSFLGFGSWIENATGGSAGDRLTGNDLANRLDGAAGADTLTGGAGNDSYVVDNSGDLITESSTGGIDTLYSSVSRTLGSYQEHLTLTGTGSTAGSGNTQANQLTGNAAANRLDGRAGNDTLKGNAGNDRLTGSDGRDTLTGGSGNDIFDFNLGSDSGPASTQRDLITDFVRGSDRIDLATIDADSTAAGDQAFSTFISAATTFSRAGQLKLSAGVLYANTDSDSSAELSIAVTGITSLSLSDLIA